MQQKLAEKEKAQKEEHLRQLVPDLLVVAEAPHLRIRRDRLRLATMSQQRESESRLVVSADRRQSDN